MKWQEKAAQARQLMEEVRDSVKAGLDGAEAIDTNTKKTEAAQALFAEVRDERSAERKSKLEEITKAFEAGEFDADPEDQVIDLASRKAAHAEKRDEQKIDGDGFVLGKNGRPREAVLKFTSRSKDALPGLFTKALTEGSAAGTFLVPPEFAQDLFAETRRQGNVLRRLGWMNIHQTNSNLVYVPQGSGAATFGIVAEGTAKPTQDQSYTQISVPIYTAAGISNLTQPFVNDSNPAATDFVYRELGSLAGNFEEQMALNGTGTGQPLGILNTSGIGNTAVTAGTVIGQAILDGILSAVVNIQTSFFAPPSGVLMHPRRLAYLMKTKDSQNNYIINPMSSTRAPVGWPSDGVASVTTGGMEATYSLLGLPVAVSTNIPTNLGGGTEDAIIVGAWRELHWFQRQDVTMDATNIGGNAFENNLVKYRLEERFGLTAARYPKAFSTVTGSSLAAANV